MVNKLETSIADKIFHQGTLDYLNNTPIEYRRSLGQYFTPRPLIEELYKQLPPFIKPKILDPGCGTGEFLLTARDWFKGAELNGWEVDDNLVAIARDAVPEAHIEQADTLRRNKYESYDLVVGNPPYFEFKPDKDIRAKYGHLFSGRVNIYALFIFQSIKLLRNGGYLAFVVSPSMNNGAFFVKLRKFIVDNCNIEYMSVLDSPDMFSGALQSVMLLILRKKKNNGSYIFRKDHLLIFSENSKYLEGAFKNRVTLVGLSYIVRTGRFVWNDHKEVLTDEAEGNVPIIWAGNITSKGLVFWNAGKPQYAKLNQESDVGPAIVVNRIVGRPGMGAVRAALVPEGFKFVGENHVNVIFPPKQASLLSNKRIVPLESLVHQLNSPEKSAIVRSITGNTQISKTELEHLFPIDPC